MQPNKLTAALAAIGVLAAATAMVPGAALSAQNLKKVSIGYGKKEHRPVVTVVRAEFRDGRWRLAKTDVHFNLWVYVKVSAGSGVGAITLTAPSAAEYSGTTWTAFSGHGQGKGPRKKLVHHARHRFDQARLGTFGTRLAEVCSRSGDTGTFFVPSPRTMPIRVRVLVTAHTFTGKRARWRTATRHIVVRVHCKGKPAAPRAGKAPTRAATPFRIAGVGVRLTAIGKRCPRTVFATAVVSANKPGKVRYVLRSNRGRRWIGLSIN